jgi:hypothetical protein
VIDLGSAIPPRSITQLWILTRPVLPLVFSTQSEQKLDGESLSGLRERPSWLIGTFKYDPFGRRIKKVTSTTTSIFAYDGDNLIEETNATGGVVARYEDTQNIDEPLAMLPCCAQVPPATSMPTDSAL